jgi:hypothetical protein
VTDTLKRQRAALKIGKHVYTAPNEKRKARRCDAKFRVYLACTQREKKTVLPIWFTVWHFAEFCMLENEPKHYLTFSQNVNFRNRAFYI